MHWTCSFWGPFGSVHRNRTGSIKNSSAKTSTSTVTNTKMKWKQVVERVDMSVGRRNKCGTWFSFTQDWKASRQQEIENPEQSGNLLWSLCLWNLYFPLAYLFVFPPSPYPPPPPPLLPALKGSFSEVNHSRSQAPHHSYWRSELHRAVGVNMGVLNAVSHRWE